MNRRIFIKNGIFGLNGALLSQGLNFDPCGNEVPYPYTSLNDAFLAIGFDPKIKGNTYFVVTADVHYGSAGDGMATFISEVNIMHPQPAFFCVNGDMIINGSRSFGVIPDANERQRAVSEFRDFRKDADKLDRNIPIKITLGNHDTHPKEIDPELFWEVFPGYPPYQSMELEGIQIFFLNGHSTGYIDSVQAEWLKNEVLNIGKEKAVIIFVHQPSMSHRVRERGIPKVVSETFANHTGNIWLIGGHEHTNAQKIFQLKNTKLVEHHITCGTINIWGGPEKPGYWVYCLKEGSVYGRIYKQRGNGYRIEPPPELHQGEKVPLPFDNVKNILWKVLVGEGDHEYLIESKASDCLNYWAYVKKLIYRVPLRANNNAGKEIALLTDYNIINADKQDQYFLSSDLSGWTELKLKYHDADVLYFKIPDIFIGYNDVYFKFTPLGEASVAGVALLS